MDQRIARFRGLFISLVILIPGLLIVLLAYNLGYSKASATLPSPSTDAQVRTITTTLEVALDPVVQALQGQPTSPVTLEAVLTLPSQTQAKGEADDKFRFALFTSGLTLAASLLTALLGFAYNYFTSKESRQFEWAKYVWGKYEQEYLEFARVLRSTLDPNIVQVGFDELKGIAFIPREIRRGVETYVGYLKTEENTEKKLAKRESLCSEFEAFLKRPWEHV